MLKFLVIFIIEVYIKVIEFLVILLLVEGFLFCLGFSGRLESFLSEELVIVNIFYIFFLNI